MTTAKKPSAFEAWYTAHGTPGYQYLQGKAWSAALAAVEEQMPGPIVGIAVKSANGIGWNNCLSTMSERIAALRSEET
jgi:hypothetical protein